MRSQNRPSRSGLSVRLLLVSVFVTSPDDQSRICFGDASPIRIASNSLMSIKVLLFPLGEFWSSGLFVDFHVGEVCIELGQVGVDVGEGLVGRDGQLAVLVDPLLALLELLR